MCLQHLRLRIHGRVRVQDQVVVGLKAQSSAPQEWTDSLEASNSPFTYQNSLDMLDKGRRS